jgi:hypothetical protein
LRQVLLCPITQGLRATLMTALTRVATYMGRMRRLRPVIAVAILVYAAVIGLTGGFDITLGPFRVRSHHTDWLLRLAVIAAFAELVIRDSVIGKHVLVEHGRAIYTRLRRATLRTLLAIVGVVAGLWVLGLLSRLIPVETPSGDMALLELYTRQAIRGELLLGPYSRFQWHHPGPLMFYLTSPLYDVSGDRFASLRVSALLLNIGCLVSSLAIIRRYGGRALLLSTGATLALFLWRVSDVLVSPWNPHLLLLPLVLLLVCCAALMEGTASLLVAIVTLASFLIQTHLSIAPTVGVAIMASVVVLIARLNIGRERHAFSRALNWSLWAGLCLWFLPLAEQITSANGNLSTLYQFFTEPNYASISRESYAAFFRMLSGFMLPGFVTAWGGQQVNAVSWSNVALSMTSLIALPWAAAKYRARGDRFGADLALLLLAASLTALWSLLRIRGEVLDQIVFWITALGVLNLSCVAAALLGDINGRVAGSVAALCVILTTMVGVAEIVRRDRPSYDIVAATRISTGAAAITSYLQREKVTRPLVYLAQPAWGDVAGIVVQLEKSGIHVSIEREWLFMFGQRYAENGTEDSTLVFADPVRRVSMISEQHYAIIAEWPELTIFARRRAATTAD